MAGSSRPTSHDRIVCDGLGDGHEVEVARRRVLLGEALELAERDPLVDRLRRRRHACVRRRLDLVDPLVQLVGDELGRQQTGHADGRARDERHADHRDRPPAVSRRREPHAARGSTGAGTAIVCSCVSVTLALSVDGLTAQAAWIAGLAVGALVLAGWRKPARAKSRQPRGRWVRERRPILVDHDPAPLYRRPGPIRRVVRGARERRARRRHGCHRRDRRGVRGGVDGRPADEPAQAVTDVCQR